MSAKDRWLATLAERERVEGAEGVQELAEGVDESSKA